MLQVLVRKLVVLACSFQLHDVSLFRLVCRQPEEGNRTDQHDVHYSYVQCIPITGELDGASFAIKALALV